MRKPYDNSQERKKKKFEAWLLPFKSVAFQWNVVTLLEKLLGLISNQWIRCGGSLKIQARELRICLGGRATSLLCRRLTISVWFERLGPEKWKSRRLSELCTLASVYSYPDMWSGFTIMCLVHQHLYCVDDTIGLELTWLFPGSIDEKRGIKFQCCLDGLDLRAC